MQSPKVLFINRVYPPQRFATGRLLQDLASRFVEEGWQVEVLTTGPQKQSKRENGLRVVRMRSPDRPRIAAYPWLWFKFLIAGLRSGSYDLVVTMSDPPLLGFAGHIIARAKNTKHIHWCQDYYPGIMRAMGLEPPEPVRKFLDYLNRISLQSADKIIVPGRCMAKRMLPNGIPAKKISVIPNWPDKVLSQSGEKAAHYSHELKKFDDVQGSKPYAEQVKEQPKFRVLYAGNLGRAHPIEPILKAAEVLQEPHPEIEFVFVGDGQKFDKLAAERDRRGLENIRFLPYQPDSKLLEIMESGDVHLITMGDSAAGHMVPSKIYAAFAAGRPAIFVGPRACEAAQAIKDYKAGEIVRTRDYKKLARIIKNYRLDSDYWFAAQEGATEAGKILTPEESIKAWLARALSVIQGAGKDTENAVQEQA